MSRLPLGFGPPDDPPEEAPVYTVSQLNKAVRALLEEAFSAVWVEGEVSNFTHHRSGHMYFTLKDEAAQLDAAMFRTANQRLTFQPENGMRVLALAQATVYEPRGRYQVVVQALRPAGVGQLQRAYERLKAALQAEGLFDRKRPLPRYPNRIGVVTAAGAAALRDIHHVLARRYPVVEVLLFPAQVQGQGAAQQVAAAIALANRYSKEKAPIDVLIVGRGGGSLEDLWAFNEEVTARAIAASEVPVVSAVGHEVDVTIADFAADVRAPTPSAAAELVVPDRSEVRQTVRVQAQRLARATVERWREAQQRLGWLQRSHGLRRPVQRLRDAAQRLDQARGGLAHGLRERVRQTSRRHELLLTQLERANPAAILKRGYASVRGPDGRPVTDAVQLKPGDALALRLHKGRARARVEKIEHG